MQKGAKMSKPYQLYVAILLLASSLSEIAGATTGPLQTPLRVTQMYTADPNTALYVSFQTGAMPGCYGNSGGYLYTSNAFYCNPLVFPDHSEVEG
jgi:hypothetical protein